MRNLPIVAQGNKPATLVGIPMLAASMLRSRTCCCCFPHIHDPGLLACGMAWHERDSPSQILKRLFLASLPCLGPVRRGFKGPSPTRKPIPDLPACLAWSLPRRSPVGSWPGLARFSSMTSATHPRKPTQKCLIAATIHHTMSRCRKALLARGARRADR